MKIAEKCHKLVLYVNDVVLHITNLGKSLPALMQVINNYSSVSGYRINVQECEAMTLGSAVCRELKNGYLWKWDMDRVKYLVTVIPKNSELL